MTTTSASDSTFLERVHTSCEANTAADGELSIHRDAVAKFAAKVAETVKDGQVAGMGPNYGVPLRFDTAADELNFWGLVYAIAADDFKYDDILAAECGRNTFETCQLGVISMFLSQKTSTNDLCNMSTAMVASHFDISVDQEVEVMPAVYQTQAGVCSTFATGVAKSMNALGAKLFARQAGHMGEFLLGMVNKLHKDGRPASASAVVEELVATFACFKDSSDSVYRRAQELTMVMFSILSEKEPAFRFQGLDRLTVFPNAALVKAVLALGLVDAAKDTHTQLLTQKFGKLVDATVCACDMVASQVDVSKGGVVSSGRNVPLICCVDSIARGAVSNKE